MKKIKELLLRVINSLPPNLQRFVLSMKTCFVPTEFFPLFDRMIILTFYRFPFFRNKYLSHPQEFFDETVPTTNNIFNFELNKDALSAVETDGITDSFKMNDDLFEKVVEQLDDSLIDWDGQLMKKPVREILELDHKEVGIAQAHYQELESNPVIARIGKDPSVLNFVSSYLKSKDVSFQVTAWWNFPLDYSEIKSDYFGKYNYAREYHYDHVSRRGCRLFFYITDCDMESGAHSYIKGTLRKKPFAISLKQLNLTEEQMEKFIPKNDNWVYKMGPAGSGFIMDPFGMHCGIKPTKKPRLILQFIYNVDLIGKPHMSTSLNIPKAISSQMVRNSFQSASEEGTEGLQQGIY